MDGTDEASSYAVFVLDRDIRWQLADELAGTFPGDLIKHEMHVCLGATRIDLAVVNGSLHGYEIKSDADTLARLPRQIELYDRVLDYSTVVCGPRHAKHVEDALPPHWGIRVVGEESARRVATRNPRVQAFAVAQLLWRDECAAILADRGERVKTRDTRWQLWDRLALLPIGELQDVVRAHLKARPAERAVG